MPSVAYERRRSEVTIYVFEGTRSNTTGGRSETALGWIARQVMIRASASPTAGSTVHAISMERCGRGTPGRGSTLRAEGPSVERAIAICATTQQITAIQKRKSTRLQARYRGMLARIEEGAARYSR